MAETRSLLNFRTAMFREFESRILRIFHTTMEQEQTPKTTLQIARQFLGKTVSVVFDRPLGSKHPKHGFEYKVNYGYIPGVFAADGEELDVYYLGVTEPLMDAQGVCIAIIHRENDDDDKLVVVPVGTEMSDQEIMDAVHFQEQFFISSVVRE